MDQTAGDMSLQYGLTDALSPQRMLEAALAEHPDAQILIKTHPDVLAGKKRGCLPLQAHPRITVIQAAVNPLVLLREVEQVYVLTSQLGLEALLLGKPVTCFGMPFYAGWGLTDDRVRLTDPQHVVFQRRKRTRSLVEVVAAAYFSYTRYVHPDSGQRCEPEAIVEYVAEQHRLYRENAGRLFCFGFTRWKRNYIRRFLHAPGNQLVFVWSRAAALRHGFDANAHIVAWGERAMHEAEILAAESGVPVWRVEDGFIRSAGLGSDYTPPLSLVLDKRGIYYDPAQPSDLEYLLQNHAFTPELLTRASLLRNKLLEYALSKYNLGSPLSRAVLKAKTGQRIILVPGQVEDDASIRKGCRDIAGNTALLKAVRSANPKAWVIYKPHPDVVSGNRKGRVTEIVLRDCCDQVLEDVSITDCLDWVDEVHTLTSLVGFEALLRGRRVVCYGLPFYAGWGLTEDRHLLSRRTRRLQLDELVAATLILYPRYMNWETGAFTTPEWALETLHRQLVTQGGKQKNKVPAVKRLWHKAVHIYQGVFNFRY
ncbi:MAG: capsular polysaccharide biosynthesis protein [Thiolinea sp.]